MSYKITSILLTVAFLTCTQSFLSVNCPTNYYWNVQTYMCVQQSACQSQICLCYHSTCQHIQTCYAQVPCIYWNQTIETTTQKQSEKIKSTTPTIITTTTPTTTMSPISPVRDSKEWLPLDYKTNTIDIKLTNVIHFHNHIHNPVYINNTNIINHEVHTHHEIQKNRTTTSPIITTTSTATTTNIKPTKDRSRGRNSTQCCTVYSPKVCKERYDASWYCYHSKYRRCGSFCYREKVFLRPRHVEYRPPILIIPPPSRSYIENYYNEYDYQSTIDCSGCVYGGYQCSSACYKYNCNTNRCGYIDQEYFCGHFGGFGCYEYDGYFDNNYY